MERLEHWLKESSHVTKSELDSIYEKVQQQIASAIEFAKNSPEPDPSEVRMHVYARLKRGKSHSLGYVFAILIVLTGRTKRSLTGSLLSTPRRS